MEEVWTPLRELLGAAGCVDFMYMGQSEGTVFRQGQTVKLFLYKHVHTRRYVTSRWMDGASDIVPEPTHSSRQKRNPPCT
jgi:hypothetical protein